MSDKPIVPTRVIPAGETLPATAAPPPPPASPDPEPDWWRTGGGPSGPPPPIDVHVRVEVDVPAGGWLVPADPESGPRWWGRIRLGYNAACAVAGFILCGPWAWVLVSVRDEASLAGAWVMALIPLTVIAFIDNARKVEALHADPDLWAPRLKAAIARTLLCAFVEATALSLPITTLIYVMTGVR